MKAKIRKTGELVDVIAYSNLSTIRSSRDYVSYIDSKGVEHDRDSLNYYWDFEPIEMVADEHWQDVREKAAIAAMQGVMNFFGSFDYNKETIAKLAVEQADFRCRDCVHYKNGKTYCKIAKHSISSDTIADNCNAFVEYHNEV